MSDWTRGVDGPIAALANRWIIDYFARILWRHFEDNTGAPVGDWIESFVDDRSGLIQDEGLLDHLEQQNRHLIRFMCRMSSCATGVVVVRDGGGGGSTGGEGWTEMEEAIDLVERIVSVGNHGLSAKELLRVRLSIRQQAVYACCREGNFDLAAKVFFRQWKSWDTDEEMEARRNIAQILDSRNHEHELLSAMPFKTTLHDCKTFLRKIFARMSPPFLITAAKNVWERMNSGDGVKSTDTDALVKKVKREKIDVAFGNFEQEQRSRNSSDVLVNKVCSLKGNVPSELQMLPGPNQPMVQRPSSSERTVTILQEAGKEQTYPLLLWTNSISPESITSAECSASVYRLNDVQPRVGPEFVESRRAVSTVDPGLFLGINSNQFPIQKEIYFNTVPVVSSRIYTTSSLIQDSGNLIENCGLKGEHGNVRARVAKNVSTVQDSALIAKAEPDSICQPKSKFSWNSKYKLQDVIDVEADGLTSKECVLGKKLVTSSKRTGKKFHESFNSPKIQAKARLSTTKNFADNTGQQSMRNTRNNSKIASTKGGVDTVPKRSPVIQLEQINQNARNVVKSGRSEHILRRRSYFAADSARNRSNLSRNDSYRIPSLRSKREHTPSRSSTARSLPKKTFTATTARSDLVVPPSTRSIQNSWIGDAISVKDNASFPKNLSKNSDSVGEKQNTVASKSSGPCLRKMWSLNEEETLYKAVQAHGRCWKYISQVFFTNRTPLDLISKWNNLKKHLMKFEKRFGPLRKD